MKKNNTARQCTNCGKEYDRAQLRRAFGEYSGVYQGGFCSAYCHTMTAIYGHGMRQISDIAFETGQG